MTVAAGVPWRPIGDRLPGRAGSSGRAGRSPAAWSRRTAASAVAGRQPGDDPLDVGEEAHVEHLVGLVEDERAQPGRAADAAVQVVEQPAGGGDDEVDAGAQGPLLRDRSATPPMTRADRSGVPAARPRNTPSICWASSRVGVRTRAPVGAAGPVEEAVQDRQQERGGLAGAGLGGGDEVAAGQDGRDGLGLDRGRGDVAEGLGVSREERGKGRVAEKASSLMGTLKNRSTSVIVARRLAEPNGSTASPPGRSLPCGVGSGGRPGDHADDVAEYPETPRCRTAAAAVFWLQSIVDP